MNKGLVFCLDGVSSPLLVSLKAVKFRLHYRILLSGLSSPCLVSIETLGKHISTPPSKVYISDRG